MKRNKTSSCWCWWSVVIVNAILMVSSAGFEFKVGDDDMGWQVPPNNNSKFYTYWASSHRFRVGDSLSFLYKNDSVLMVEKWEYYHCNSSDPIMAFNNGKALIKLDRPGLFFFISGFPDHCKHGQRLLVQVMSPHLVLISPPSLPPDSSTYYADAAPSPSSHNNAAASTVSLPGPLLVLLLISLLF